MLRIPWVKKNILEIMTGPPQSPDLSKAVGGFIEENKIWCCHMIFFFIANCLFFVKITVNTLQLLKFYLSLKKKKYKNIYFLRWYLKKKMSHPKHFAWSVSLDFWLSSKPMSIFFLLLCKYSLFLPFSFTCKWNLNFVYFTAEFDIK